jgi:hypothetical protein
MATTSYTAERASERARELYESVIRARVEPDHIGEYLVMNLDTGDYVVGNDSRSVSDLAATRFPDTARFGIRVGQWVVGRVGGRVTPLNR